MQISSLLAIQLHKQGLTPNAAENSEKGTHKMFLFSPSSKL